MHVLIVPSAYPTVSNPVSGIFFRQQARALRKRGLNVGVVFPDHRSLAGKARRDLIRRPFRVSVEDDDGIATYLSTYPAIPKAPRARSRIWLWQLQRLLKRYVAERGVPDIVHAHGILWGGVGAVRFGLAQQVPVVITAHFTAYAAGLIRPWEAGPISGALNGADAVLAVSGPLRVQLQPFAPDAAVEVVPNLVDTGAFSLVERAERSEYRWLAVGALTSRKGLDVLLHAFATGFRDRPAVRLTIVGEGPEAGPLQLLANRLGLGERVTFTGRLDHDQIRSRMQQADAFVLSSRIETFGVVLIEAMATGLPVVATACGGPEDFVHPGVGRLVDPDDAAELAGAMVDIYDERVAWRGRAAEIRSYVDSVYSEAAVTSALTGVYDRVAGALR